MGGYAHGTTTTRISELHVEVMDVATKMADDVMSSDEDNDDNDDGAPTTAALTM
jgi:cobalamin biosynthesis protein CobT